MASGTQVIIYDETQVHFRDGLKVVGKHEKLRHAIWPMQGKGSPLLDYLQSL
jgi:hypothetical protein